MRYIKLNYDYRNRKCIFSILTPKKFVKSVINFRIDMEKRIKVYTIRRFCLKNILLRLFNGCRDSVGYTYG